MPNYPDLSLNNPFLMARLDRCVIDGKGCRLESDVSALINYSNLALQLLRSSCNLCFALTLTHVPNLDFVLQYCIFRNVLTQPLPYMAACVLTLHGCMCPYPTWLHVSLPYMAACVLTLHGCM